VLVNQEDIRNTKVVDLAASDKSLLDIQVKRIESSEELEALYEVCRETNTSPIFPTHIALKRGRIIGCFSIKSPTVYWWMNPDTVTGRESLPIFQACDALMSEHGNQCYVLPCEPESPFFKILSKRLDTIKTEGGDNFKLFLNKVKA
jgi:hypothetical protein